MNHEDKLGEIIIAPNNTMGARYTVKAIGQSTVSAEIEVSVARDSDVNTEITIKVDNYVETDMEIDIKYRFNSDILAEIQPVGHVSTDAVIDVRPGNRMWALYAIEEPPILTSVFTPSQDAFTRSREGFQSINYGGNSSLTTGRTVNDSYESFLSFDLTDFNRKFKVIGSKLRVHYSGIIPEGASLELYTVDEQWYEYGITYLNSPITKGLITDEYTNHIQEGYIELELSDTVVCWLEDVQENYGVKLRLADESDDITINFRSRESNRKPELIVTYYDTRIYSAGRSQVDAEIFVMSVGESSTLAEIEVASVYGNEDLLAELYVHKYEVPILLDYDAEITVTRGFVHGEVTVSIQDDQDTLAEVGVRIGQEDQKLAEIIVSKPEQFAELFVSYLEQVDTEIEIQRHESSSLLTEITATRESVDSEVYVKYPSLLDTEITVVRDETDDILTEIVVSNEYTDSEIYVKHWSIIDTEITVVRDGYDDTLAEIIVTRESVDSELYVRAIDTQDVDTEVYIRALGFDMIESAIAASRESTLAEITVTEYIDIDTEIFVKYTDITESEITVTVFSETLAEINIVVFSDKEAEITITRPTTDAMIVVPYWDDSETFVEILPRILFVSDIDTQLTVRRYAGAYAFII